MSAVQSTPQHAAIAASSSGNNTVVAAVTGRKVRVLAAVFVAAGAVTVKLQSGAGGTDLTGAMALAANGVLVLPFNPQGWCETAVAALLNLSLGGAVSVAGVITYVEVS